MALVALVGCGGGGKASTSPTAATATTTSTEDPSARVVRAIDADGLRHGYTDAQLTDIASGICDAARQGNGLASAFRVEDGWTNENVNGGHFRVDRDEVAKMMLVIAREVCPDASAAMSRAADELKASGV